jgi:SMC interacting uncharacterized protein involved in chromosome segregation
MKKSTISATNGFSSPEGVSLREYVDDKLDNLEKAIDARFESVTLATNTALSSADKAIQKSDIATEKRLDAVNEFRNQQKDLITTFARKREMNILIGALRDDVRALQSRMDIMTGREVGAEENWGKIIALVGLTATVVGIVSAIVEIVL